MKNKIKLWGIIALVAVIGFTMVSCATGSSIGGTSDPHGIISGNGSVSSITSSATEIGSYNVWVGLIDTGYPEYAAAVKAAEADGKQVTSVTTFYFIFTKTTAYAK